jgi:hypothetical protein
MVCFWMSYQREKDWVSRIERPTNGLWSVSIFDCILLILKDVRKLIED